MTDRLAYDALQDASDVLSSLLVLMGESDGVAGWAGGPDGEVAPWGQVLADAPAALETVRAALAQRANAQTRENPSIHHLSEGA